ncbi:MAG: VanW family protein [Candidatus Muiribacteriota bacterium]
MINGRLEDGLAGGICQITSNLYITALYADLNIVSRRAHSIYDYEWAYTPPGLDSAVSYPYLDLVIENSLKQSVLIQFNFKDNTVETKIIGQSELAYDVELVSGNPVKIEFETEKEFTDNLTEGKKEIIQPGVHGYIVETFRIRRFPDGSTEREFLAKDKYKKFNKKIKIGTKQDGG